MDVFRVLVAAAMLGLAAQPPAADGRNRALWVWDAAPLLNDGAARTQFLAICARERIGRVLRPGPDKHAVVYELITTDTSDARRASIRAKHAP